VEEASDVASEGKRLTRGSERRKKCVREKERERETRGRDRDREIDRQTDRRGRVQLWRGWA
jgi:hypothetical protein